MVTKSKLTKLIVKLLSQNTSIAVVSTFLKDRGLRHSAGSWDDLLNKRIIPSIEASELSLIDLEDLLIKTEEVGKQHVFLYSCSKIRAKETIDEKTVKRIAKKNNLEEIYESSNIVESPSSTTIADIRLTNLGINNSLTIKIIKMRWHTEYVGESIDNDLITKQWRRVPERAVNIVKLHDSGLLEIRITSQSNTSNYDHELEDTWKQVETFIPRSLFSEISLSKAKNRLLKDRDVLSKQIRYSTTTLVNDKGYSLKAAVGSHEDNLSDDLGVKNSINAFTKHNGYCDNTNIWILKSGATTELNNDIHVLISGAVNEFAIPANCIQEEYEYTLNQITKLNA